MDETKEKIKIIFESLKKSKNFSFFLSDKSHQPINLDTISHKLTTDSYQTAEILFLDLNRLWNSYFSLYFKNKDYKNIRKVIEISELTEKLFLEKDSIKFSNNKVNKNNLKIRDKSGKFTKDDKTDLVYKVMALNQEQMANIVKVLVNIKPNEKNHNFEFNVYELSEDNLLRLEEYVDKCLKLI